MPSKLLIEAGHAAAAVRKAAIFGIRCSVPAVDGPAVMRRVRQLRDHFVTATKKSFGALPPGTTIQARARFTSPTTLALSDGQAVEARAVVIATGARPVVPGSFDAVRDRILTNETIFDLPDLPRSVAVIGAGPLGLELAQALARLGVETVVFDKSTSLAGVRDEAVASALREILSEELPIHLGIEPDIKPAPDGVSVSWTGGHGVFSHLLLAAGRKPQVSNLGLAETGVELNDKGIPHFDAGTMQCGDFPIFMAGDATGDRPVLHEASSEGAIAGRNAASFPAVRPTHRAVPFSLTFTDPPVAIIGVPDETIGEASFSDQGRARVAARNAGIIRIYADAQGRLTGATLAAPGADHYAHLLVWAIEHGQSAHDLLGLPIYHPTLEEGLKPALRHICEAARLDFATAWDTGQPPGA